MASPFEDQVEEALVKRGYRVLRRGWPDFLVIDEKHNRGWALELKCGSDRLSDHQKLMHCALAQLGVLTHTVREDFLKDLRCKGRILLSASDLRSYRNDIEEEKRRISESLRSLDELSKKLDDACSVFDDPHEALKKIHDETARRKFFLDHQVESNNCDPRHGFSCRDLHNSQMENAFERATVSSAEVESLAEDFWEGSGRPQKHTGAQNGRRMDCH